jgi:hypothetical protein
MVGKEVRKVLKSLIILGAWALWRHRNDCVFNGASLRLAVELTMVGDEARAWCLAGAKGLPLLVLARMELLIVRIYCI